MSIIKCKMCGGDILLSEDKTYGTCDSCGCTMTLPRAADEQKANLYNRANHYRRQCDFDKAVAAYERILEADDRDAEAHWGVVISRFGIEYVEDPASHDYIPTCHRVQAASILKDEDYLAALQYAPDGYSRGLYEKEAARIADIQKGILAISANEEPYDVFICYKETTEGGTRTKDSTLAQEIYYQLTNEGYKVFFSRITLEDKLGQQYEPYIFAALNSAKVMLVVGSKPEYFNAVWVRNEWSRYLDIARQDRSKLLIPCYRDMDAYDLPEELGSFQSQDMSKIGFMQDLIRGVRKVLDAGKEESKPAAAVQGGPGVASLLTRARLFMEDGDFASAGEYVEKALDIDPKCAEAYIVKTAVTHRLKSDADLGKLKESIAADPDYVKALRFADPKQKAEYAGYEQSIQQGIANRAKAERYHSARYEYQHANSIDTFLAASRSLAALGDYEDAAALSAKARAQAEELRQQQLKQEEARRLEAEKKKEMERVRREKEAEERKQRELERQHRQEEQRLARQAAAQRNKKIAKIVIPIVAALTAIVMVVVFVVVPKSKYNSGIEYREKGQYLQAINVFSELSENGYSDSAEQLKETKYMQAQSLLKSGKTDEAIRIFNEIAPYKESKNYTSQAQADALFAKKQYKEAYSLYAKLPAAYRTHADWYLQQYDDAVAVLNGGDPAAAQAMFENIAYYAEKDVAGQITECRYQQAAALQEAGQYKAAADIFGAMPHYKDSLNRACQCTGDDYYDRGNLTEAYDYYQLADEAYRTHADDYAAMYADAQAKQEAGQYDEAVAVYTSISNYEQSAAKIDECRYLKAGVLAAAGQYDEAAALYDELGEYSDSSSLSAKAKADQLYEAGSYAAAYNVYAALGEAYQTHAADYAAMYADALALQTAGKFDDAEAAFAALGNYGDSTAQISETRYLKAGVLAAEGSYDAAIALYDGLGDYSDSKNLSARAKADKLYEAGSYAAAYNVYAALGEAYQTNEAGYAAMYADALALQTAGKYDDAEAAFAALGNYGDSTAQISETRYLKAGSLADAGNYDAAIALYDGLGEYSDSKDRSAQAAADRLFDAGSFAEAYDGYAALDEKYHTHGADYAAMYADAEAARVSGDFDNAYDRFIALGNYSDAGEKAVQCGKDKADSLFAAEKYGEAAQVYAFIGDAEKANESTYLYAGQLAGQGEYLQAARQYESVSDYRDSLDQRYQMGLQARVNGKLQDAYEILSADPDYRDAREAIYQTGVAASAQKLYEVSVPAFTQVGAYKDSAMKLTMDTYAWGGQLFDNADYDKSAEVFASMGEFSDAPARANAARYAAAGAAMENGAYDDAAARYEALGDYKDSAERARNAAYAAADEKLEAGEYADAKARFEKLGTFKDSKDKVQECDYRPAMDLFNAGDYAAAKAAFLALGSYSSSADMAKECDYIPAKALYDAKQYADALNMFERNGLAGYKDGKNIMNDCRYQLGKAEMLAGDYAAARDWFDAAGNYSDAKAQGDECRYQIAMAHAAVLEAAGDYEAAYAQYELAGNTAKTREMAYQTAIVRLSESDYEGAVAWYEKAGDYSDAKEQILNIGEYYYATQQYEAAETVYVKVVGTGVAAQRLYELGQYYELVGDLERAAKAYGEAGEYEDAPEKADAMQYQVAERLFAAKDWEGAKAEYLKIPGYKDVDSKVTACDNEIAVAAAAAAHEAAIAPFKKVGNYVTFGHYEQDNNTGNGKEAIEWLVLDVQGDKVLLVSRYALDCKRYNTTTTGETWETCSLRTWLNGTFINAAFTADEQKAVMTTTVDNSKSQGYFGYSTKGGNNTQDKVFLLSYAEAWKYFKSDDARKCQPTKYAVAQNAYKASNGNCRWWLRSPGPSSADFVYDDGAHPTIYVSGSSAAVRPAFWLDLSSDIF